MKLILIWLLLGAATVRATIIIPVAVGPPRVTEELVVVENNGLAGTSVAGQTLSLDFVFSSPIWAAPSTLYGKNLFTVLVRAHTNRAPFSGDYSLLCFTSWLVREDGSQGPTLNFSPGGFIITGPGAADLAIGLARPDEYMPGFYRVYSGMHTEVQMPDLAGVELTGLGIELNGGGGGFGTRWAVLNSTPDTGSTIWLTLGTLAGLAVLRKKI